MLFRSPEGFLRLIEAARRVRGDFSITTDIIVGFPGETEEAFNETLRFAAAAAFSGGHVFPFSPRPGTAAAKLPEPVAKGGARRCARPGGPGAQGADRSFRDTPVRQMRRASPPLPAALVQGQAHDQGVLHGGGVVAPAPARRGEASKIGRASCRERV